MGGLTHYHGLGQFGGRHFAAPDLERSGISFPLFMAHDELDVPLPQGFVVPLEEIAKQ